MEEFKLTDKELNSLTKDQLIRLYKNEIEAVDELIENLTNLVKKYSLLFLEGD